MIDFSLKTGKCHEYLNNLFEEHKKYNPDIIKNYPFFNYLLRSGTPNNFRHGKFGILLAIFLGIIKKFDGTLIRYFDSFYYQLLRELDFTRDGLTIPNMEVNAFKSFLNSFSDLTSNIDIKILSDNLCVVPENLGDNSDAIEIIDDIDMLLCHVIVRYNVERIMKRHSSISQINIFEINKMLLIKYFPRTFLLLGNFEVVPSEFLINSPFRMYHYANSLGDINKDSDVERLLRLELKIFETKFFMEKRYLGYVDVDSIRDLINCKVSRQPIQMNDTISILHDFYKSDVDLERWTGNKMEDTGEMTDIIVYYDYISDKVRHQALSGEARDILSFFLCGERKKEECLEARGNSLNMESLLNELIFKGILF